MNLPQVLVHGLAEMGGGGGGEGGGGRLVAARLIFLLGGQVAEGAVGVADVERVHAAIGLGGTGGRACG